MNRDESIAQVSYRYRSGLSISARWWHTHTFKPIELWTRADAVVGWKTGERVAVAWFLQGRAPTPRLPFMLSHSRTLNYCNTAKSLFTLWRRPLGVRHARGWHPFAVRHRHFCKTGWFAGARGLGTNAMGSSWLPVGVRAHVVCSSMVHVVSNLEWCEQVLPNFLPR